MNSVPATGGAAVGIYKIKGAGTKWGLVASPSRGLGTSSHRNCNFFVEYVHSECKYLV